MPCRPVAQAGDAGLHALLGPYPSASPMDSAAELEGLLSALCDSGALAPTQLPVASQLAGSLVHAARREWRAGGVAGAVLAVLAAAKGRQLLPAQAAAAVRAGGGDASAADVRRHKQSAWVLWKVTGLLVCQWWYTSCLGRTPFGYQGHCLPDLRLPRHARMARILITPAAAAARRAAATGKPSWGPCRRRRSTLRGPP